MAEVIALKRNLEWYRSHDSLTKIKLKNQIIKDAEHFIDSSVVVIGVTMKELGHFYDVSGSNYGDQIISELARLISCFFDENYIYRDGYNGFIVITDYLDYSSRLTRLKENCAQYQIQGYLVFSTLDFSATKGYVKEPQQLQDLLHATRSSKPATPTVRSISAAENDEKDAQTNLLNIDAFRRKTEEFLAEHDLLKEKYVFVYLDVRNFHLYNQRFGHDSSTKMIRFIARLLQKQFDDGLACHITMDRFIIFVREQDIEDRLTQLFQTFDVHYNLEFVYLIAGLYRINEKIPASTAIERARIACSSLKEKSEKNFCYFDEETRRVLLKEKMIIENLEDGIHRGDLEIYYQPVLRTMTGEIASYEAVSRWRRGKNDVLLPEDYVSVLEDHHMIHILDIWMIEQVCKDLARRRYNKEAILPCSVNLSLHDFELCDLIEILNKQTALYQLPRNYLMIEIRNYDPKNSDDFIEEQLQRLHYLGYRIYLDNFGTNLVPLHIFDHISVDGFKINVHQMPASDQPSRLLIRSLVRVAKEMGMMTVLVGIESKEQADFARNIASTYMQGKYLGEILPYEQIQKQEDNKHLVMETSAERNYQDTLSLVDLGKMQLSGDPQPNVPVAITELTGHTKHIIVANEAFRQLAHRIGVQDMTMLDRITNTKPAIFNSHMSSIISKTKSAGTIEPFEVVINNYSIKLNIKFLKANGEKEAYVISVDSAEPIVQHGSLLSPVLRYFYKRYELIYLFSPLSSRVECLYQGDTLNVPVDASVVETIKKLVYSGDEKRLDDFFNAQRILTKVYSSSQHYIEEDFSLRTISGDYSHHRFAVSLASEDEEPMLLFTVSLSYDEADYHEEELSYDKAELFDNVVNQLHIGIFWKDINRRFVGANDTFMKFYNFKSIADFKGKTDEDIGWHVSPDAFAADEEEVLRKGVTKVNAKGTCIVNGMVHPIVAFKMPIYSNGKISGLFGFFKDIMDESPDDPDLEYRDEITGCTNALGLSVCVERYINEYKDNHRDFAVLAIGLDNMQEMTDENGLDYTHHALKKIADVIKGMSANDCVVAHILGDVFIIVHQNDDEILTRRLLANVENAIHNIVNVDGLPFTPYLSAAYQYYSRVDAHYDIIDVTLKQLVLMRDARKIATNESYKKHSLNLYRTIAREYDPVFGHIVLMDEHLHILYSQHMNNEVHAFLNQGENSLVQVALKTQNTYSDIERINGQSYYCVVKYEKLEGLKVIIEAAKRVDL